MNSSAEHVHPDLDWAASGVMAITGHAGGPPLLAPAAVTLAARTALAAAMDIAVADPRLESARLQAVEAPALLGEHAALLGHTQRRGTTSAGGACHFFHCRDGWIALNLARPEDLDLLPAWLGATGDDEVTAVVSRCVRERDSAELAETGRELGLPVASVPLSPRDGDGSTGEHEFRGSISASTRDDAWFQVVARGESAPPHPPAPPRVVDLTSLWAGPLCGNLLHLAGASVFKVESVRRPDGTRRGPAAFFDLLNAGKSSVALDFTTNDGIRALRALIESADIVIESSRPRALRQLGICAEQFVAAEAGRVWVSITGYGREAPMADWVGFGDDAAAAAGLIVPTRGAPNDHETTHAADSSVPVFCGDAIADPLTGLYAAWAALDHWHRRESVLVDISLHRVATYATRQKILLPRAKVGPALDSRARDTWEVSVDSRRCAVAVPRARPVTGRAAELGADTRNVLAEMGFRC